MKIAICDDDPKDRQELMQILSQLRKEDEFECFTNSAELLRALRCGVNFSCLFLDILMPGLTGIELASKIREKFPDSAAHIVFITSSQDYAIEAFAHNAVHYIVKPIRAEDVAEALRRIPAHPAQRQGIFIKVGHVRRFLYIDEIAVCESSNHRVHILLRSGETIACAQTFEHLRQQLGDRLLLVSRGIMVNFNYIAEMDRSSCTLLDGRKILLSRRNRKQIWEAYDNFIFSQLNK